MDSRPDWRRVAPILQAALDMPADGRARFVREACAGDSALLAELESLLVAHGQAGAFLESPPTDLTAGPGSAGAASDPGFPARFAAGQRFGPYRIIRLLGRGGMGEVYEADHLEHGRRVALKVLNRRLTDAHDRARFLREGELAAAVTHPNLVYVFGSEDIDATAAIAMELLPGGTLKDRVRDLGPLSPSEAVDSILQLIAGLEAAHAGGVLHRDVKPANCFIDRDGTVKVGDFGLSISTSSDVTRLTQSSGLRATPQFAPPEQLKGETLDVRADIYAVGATLYYLLTGQPPFDARELLALLARVITEVPRSPRQLVPAVPRGLAAVVLRCLAKAPAARFATYDELRGALWPYGSAPAVTPTAAKRIAAGAVDQLLITAALAIVGGALRSSTGQMRAAVPPLVTAASVAAYFALTEGLAGASLGKCIFGLRVTHVDGGRAGLARTGVRAVLFVLAAQLPGLIPNHVWLAALLSPEQLRPLADADAIGWALLLVTIVRQLFPLVLFVTARPDNGLAGIHEIASGTRVTTRARATVVAATAASPPSTVPPIGRDIETRGSYLLRASSPSSTPPGLRRAFDPALKRDVWIRDSPAGTPMSDPARCDLARRGRLRWLAGRQETIRTWEAFEAPRGAPLEAIAATRPWGVVRQWLADLAEELTLAARDGDPFVFDVSHVWITSDSRAMLLDVDAQRTLPRSGTSQPADADSVAARIQTFLRQVVSMAYASAAVGSERPRPPLPPAGTALLRALAEPTAPPVEHLLRLCQEALQAPTSVPGWSRALLPVLTALLLLAATFVIQTNLSATGVRILAGVGSQQDALFNGLVAVERLRRSGVPESDPNRSAIEVYLAARYAPLTTQATTLVWALWPFRPLAREIGARYPTVTEDELRAAITTLGDDGISALTRQPLADGMGIFVLVPSLVLLRLVGAFAVGSIAIAFALRGGLLLRILRLVLVDHRGAEVSRLGAMWRATLAWMPTLVLAALADRLVIALAVPSPALWLAAGAAGLVLAAGIFWGIAVPERGLPDRIAGTWLVPR